MNGIQRIAERHREVQRNRLSLDNKSLRLRDGDIAFVGIVPSGQDDDNRLGDFFLHTEQYIRDDGLNGWRSIYCERLSEKSDKPCNYCALPNSDKSRASHNFGFWAYVFHVIHLEAGDSSWEKISTPLGERFKQNVNEFMVFHRGFGRGDYLWNQLVDIFNEDGALNKHIVRIRRLGNGWDTTFNIVATGQKLEIPEVKMAEMKALPSIRDYFRSAFVAEPAMNVVAKNLEKDSMTAPVQEDLALDEESLF